MTDTRVDIASRPAGPDQRPGRPRRRPVTQKGAALIAVTMALSLAAVIVTEFSTSTNVESFAAKNIEADMQAHFLARSAMNLSELVLRLQGRLDNMSQTIGDIQLTDYVGMFIGAFGGSKEEVESLAELLGGFAGDELKGMGVPEGQFDLTMTSEDGKINVNCAHTLSNVQQKLVGSQLLGIMHMQAYNPIFENEDAQGWRRDRETQVSAILDYVDRDTTVTSAAGEGRGAPEDYGYETLRDKYKPKNHRLDTVEELKLVRGIDDRFWTLFGSAFTVYGGCKVNLNELSDPNLVAALIWLTAKDEKDPVINDPVRLWALAKRVLEARELGSRFSKVGEFIALVKEPDAGIQGLLSQAALGGQSPDPTELSGLPVEGVELDAGKLGGLVATGPRRIYRVEATATYGKLQRRIVGVWDQKGPTKQNTRSPGNIESRDRGQWVYWREE